MIREGVQPVQPSKEKPRNTSRVRRQSTIALWGVVTDTWHDRVTLAFICHTTPHILNIRRFVYIQQTGPSWQRQVKSLVIYCFILILCQTINLGGSTTYVFLQR